MEKLFSADDLKQLDDHIHRIGIEEHAKPEVAITFSKRWIAVIGRSLGAHTAAVANATKKHFAERDAQINDMVHRCAKMAETVNSLERRSSRQAEHLATLESKVKRLEHGGGR
jgi:uncharacterized protein (DUF3084 family)